MKKISNTIYHLHQIHESKTVKINLLLKYALIISYKQLNSEGELVEFSRKNCYEKQKNHQTKSYFNFGGPDKIILIGA